MEMEYQVVKSALKSRTLRDNTTPFIQSQGNLLTDDVLRENEDVDVFPVEDLFIDFSNEGSLQEEEDMGSISSYDEGGGLLEDGLVDFSSQLAVPDDDLDGLEWVSRFLNDDSLPEFPALCPITPSDLEPGSVFEHPRFPSQVPVKPRSKRPRVSRNDRPSQSESSSSSGNSSSVSCLPLGVGMTFMYCRDEARRKSNRTVRPGSPPWPRRCTHCLVQRTPQWRSGPLGPKTLCNACGVRYKSGRLLPEYRPACSPTFSIEIHSNSHRKVLELRRLKEMDVIG